ncbi:M23 family metallopeptidase [Sphingomonas sp.]|uniref:M23 family metallopeptidase n=1 Tax=Sphingomonas sp. TaxID=28214 RepID=UPI00286B336B|nr:M23 family metallopeptidase [Sphingomonas sp.]
MREAWLGQGFGRAAVAAPVGFVSFDAPRPAGSLVVDLGENLFSNTWWRGLVTLGLLCTAAALTAPDFGPLPAGHAPFLSGASRAQWRAVGVDSLSRGSDSGMRMAPGALVEPLQQAPERTAIDLFATLGQDGLARSLARLGASDGDAIIAANLVHAAVPRLAPGTQLTIRLGQRDSAGRRPVERLSLRASMELKLLIERGAGGLGLTRIAVPIDSAPMRVRGVAGDGLYWALRTAGASSATSASYLKALAQEIDVGEIAPGDRFDLVIASRTSADGQRQEGDLLYAGLDRTMGGKLQLVRWTAGGKPVWVNAATVGQVQRQSEGMIWPVAARINSTFGPRLHPILRFVRMHRGIDFGAHWGMPIHAAADGQVVRAGWAGGYGRQVRLAHSGGLASSYSHMSSMTVSPGTIVHQGDLIGYVGSSGLSTGPHLHYEVLRDGVAINPMGVRFSVATRGADPGAVSAIKARLAKLLRVGAKRAEQF